MFDYRDLFYLIMREWAEHHNTPNWSMETALGDKIRSVAPSLPLYLLIYFHIGTCIHCHHCRMLTQQYGEVCSLAHFAKLFERQMVEVKISS